MTASVYRWLSGKLDHMTGEDALILVGVIAGISVFVGASIVAAWSLYWPPIRRNLALVVSALIRWHARHIKREPKRQVWPIPFVERPVPHREPWPILATVALVALVLAIMFNCGFKGV